MRRHKSSRPAKIIITILVIGLVVFVIGKVTRRYLRNSQFFAVKTVLCTGAFKSLLKDNCDCFELQGKNLFAIDIKHLAKSLKLSYPYLTRIRVSRIIPDKVWFDAQERVALARVRLGNKVFLCDEDAVIIPLTQNRPDLALISGIDAQLSKVRIGETYHSPELESAISLLKEINKTPELKDLSLVRIDVVNPENINLFLKSGLKVIMGNEKVSQRLKLLSLVLNNLKSELGAVKYIDLRFPEPAIGKK